MTKPLYATPAVRLGKHEWRLVVQPSRFGGLCTAHQWRRIGATDWRDYHDWPRYDFNDGVYAGLPRSLGPALARYWDHIRAAATRAEDSPTPAQTSMAL